MNSAWKAQDISLVGFVSYFNANTAQREVLNSVEIKLNNLTTSVEEIKKDASSLNIFPNPTSDLTNLELNLDNSSAVIVEVIDFTGKRLLLEDFGVMSAGKQRMQLNLANLASGMYFVNVRIGDQVVTRKVSVTK